MKLRVFRPWPALFVALLAFVAGPVAYGSDEWPAAATMMGVADDAVHDPAVLDVVAEVATLCEVAMLRANRGFPGARDCRDLALSIDGAVERALRDRPVPSAAAQRALADLLVVADAMRSPDNRIRKAALARCRRAEPLPMVTAEADGRPSSAV